MNQRKIGAILSYLNIFVVILTQLIYTPIMLYILGQNEFGVYSLSESIIAYLGLLNFGFSGSYLKFYSKYKLENDILSIKRLNAIYLIVFIGISILIFIGGYTIVQNINSIVDRTFTIDEINLTKVLLSIMTINMAVMMPNNVFSAITVAHEKFIFAKSLVILKNLGSPLISLPILLLGYGSKGMSYALLFMSIISLVLNIYYCKQKLKIGFEFRNLDLSIIKKISSFSIFIFLWSIVDQLNWQIGKILLASLVGSAAVAIYTIGMQFNSLFIAFSTAICGVFTPQIYKHVYEPDGNKKLTELMIKVGRIQFYIVFFVWIIFVIFGRSFIMLWAGKEFENSYYVGLLLTTPIIIALMQNVGIEILRAYNKHQMRTMLHMLLAIINVIISIPLTKMYGEIGCAIGTCISTFVSSTLISNYFYSKVINLDIKAVFKEFCKFVPAMVIVAVVGTIITMFKEISTWIDLVVGGLGFTIIYVLVMVYFAFNDYERALLRRVIGMLKEPKR